MNSDTLMRQLAGADIYAPDHDLPDTAHTPTVALAEARRKVVLMDAKQEPAQIGSPKPGRPAGWLVSAAAFLVVVLVLGAAILIGNATSDEPPATTPTTTTLPSTLNPEVLVESMVAELNAGNHSGAVTRVRSAGQVLGGREGSPNLRIEQFAALYEILYEKWTALDSELAIESCVTIASGITRCVVTRSSPFDPFAPEPETLRFELRTRNGKLEYVRQTPIVTDPWFVGYSDFAEWIADNAPTDVSTAVLFPTNGAEAATLQREWVELYRADRNADPPFDEQVAAVVTALADAVTSGDEDTIRRIFGDARSVVSSDTTDADDRARETGRWIAWALLDSITEVVECATLTSGPTQCEVTRTSPHDFSSGDPQILRVLVSSLAADQVDLIKLDFVTGAWVVAESDFAEWVSRYANPAFVPMFVDFHEPERTAALFRELHPLWVESAG